MTKFGKLLIGGGSTVIAALVVIGSVDTARDSAESGAPKQTQVRESAEQGASSTTVKLNSVSEKQSQQHEGTVEKAEASARLLSAEGVVWMKHMSLGLSAEMLPHTPACDAVQRTVLKMLQHDSQMLELNNKAFGGGHPRPFDDQTRVDVLDSASDIGNQLAAGANCRQWQESRKEVIWWFRGLSAAMATSDRNVSANTLTQKTSPSSSLRSGDQPPLQQFSSERMQTRFGVFKVKDGALTYNDIPVRDRNNLPIEADHIDMERAIALADTDVILVHTNCGGSSCGDHGDTRFVSVTSSDVNASQSFGYGRPKLAITKAARMVTVDYGKFGKAVFDDSRIEIPPALTR